MSYERQDLTVGFRRITHGLESQGRLPWGVVVERCTAKDTAKEV